MDDQKGFSLIELIIVVAIILVIAAIAIPNLLKSRQRANEAAAASTLRTLHTSEATYLVTFGTQFGYADSLNKLGPAATCDASHACLIDANLGCATAPCSHNGYKYYLISSFGSAPFGDYVSSATPEGWNVSGTKNFCGSEDGMVRFQVGATSSLAAAVPHSTCVSFTVFTSI